MESWVVWIGLLFFVVGVAGAVLPTVSVLRHQLLRRRRGTEPSPVRELARDVVAGAPESDFSARQVRLYADYHERALAESSLSFRMAAAAAGVGFLVILASIAVLVFRGGDTAWLGAVSGVVFEAVAALFLGEARSTRERAARMFDLLNAEVVRTAHTVRAVEMANGLADSGERERLLASIALKLMDPAPPPPAEPVPGEPAPGA
ncbi:hypothetical protein JOF53_003217 [Crossiella equi]|uniref:Cyanobacterial TRADD-N associated 2 transmembrane domain-containing protein n=1 Tax=Crossiella equi TaxID=130796 RepID=A0ABS5ACN7_9PSEU|nr:hypothetical protein [Crossiella equi]MBP2474345.1 hypothetical protein [Crossiella equi]